MSENKQCKWLSDDFTMVCVNDKSEHCADFVWNNECDSCKYREYEVGVDLANDK